MIKVTNIIWATDGEECLELPSTVTINSEISEEDIADYLSDTYGWLVESFVVVNTSDAMYTKAK